MCVCTQPMPCPGTGAKGGCRQPGCPGEEQRPHRFRPGAGLARHPGHRAWQPCSNHPLRRHICAEAHTQSLQGAPGQSPPAWPFPSYEFPDRPGCQNPSCLFCRKSLECLSSSSVYGTSRSLELQDRGIGDFWSQDSCGDVEGCSI